MTSSSDTPESPGAAQASVQAGKPARVRKTRVFVSYSRKDSEFANWLRGGLAEHDVEVFRDIDDTLLGEEWWRRLQSLIGQADTVVFVLSPYSVASTVCRDEVAYAQKLNKRIFPAVIADVDWASAPDGLAKIHSVFFNDAGKRAAALRLLVDALDTDIEWIREHTRLGELAHHWDTHRRRRADLLRADALDAAEHWLTQRPKTAHAPTNLHQEYIQASRMAARQRARILVAGSVAIAIATSALGAVAYLQKLEVQRSERELLLENSRMLTEFASQNLRDGDPVTAVLLAAEALPDRDEKADRPYYPSAEFALRKALRARQERLVLGGSPFITRAAVFSPDGKHILTAKNDGNGLIWDAATGKLISILPGKARIGARTASFSPDGGRILIGDDDGAARLWDAKTGVLLRQMKSEKSLRVTIFSPDGWSILTAGLDESPGVWDAATGELKFSLKGHRQGIEGAAFSADGARIVTASADRSARIWDARTGRELAKLIGHDGKIETAVFSPDGKRVLTASEDRTARIWDAASGSELDVLSGHAAAVLFAAYSPDGRRIVTTSRDTTARLWDSQIGRGGPEGTKTQTLFGHTDYVQKAAFSDDGKLIVTVSNDQSGRIWDVETGRQIAVLRGHQALIVGAVFSRDGKTVLTASEDDTARTWDVVPRPDYTVLDGHPDEVTFATFSADGMRLATTSESEARIWNGLTGEPGAALKGHGDSVVSSAFSPDAKRVVTASHDGSARLWDADSGHELKVLAHGEDTEVRSAIFSPDGRSILTASKSGLATLWDSVTGARVRDFKADGSALFGATFRPDGLRILTASANHTARIWDATSGKELAVLAGHTGDCRSAVFSPDGSLVVTAGDTTARLWNSATGAQIDAFSKGVNVLSARFAPDGHSILVLTDRPPYVWVWDSKTGEVLALTEHKDPVAHAAFNSDGRRIVTASYDGTARLWDMRTGAVIDEFKGHHRRVLYAAISPDGQRIVTASADGTARLWRVFVSTSLLMDFAKREIPRCLTSGQRGNKYGLGNTPPAWCKRLQKWPFDRANETATGRSN